ncbi:MAG: sulfatase-like hydrolase/transferase, partial [Microvirga sp.]
PAPLGYEDAARQSLETPKDLAALGGSTEQHLPGYLGMIRRLDEAFGRLAEALHSLNLLDDTIILFTSDHGCHFKTRNGEYKRSCHEASIRVPTLLHGPGLTTGRTYDGLVSLIDLPPTLLDAAGLPVPGTMQGMSILEMIRDPLLAPDEVLIQVSESHVARALRTRRWKYEVEAPGADGWNDMGSLRYVEALLYDLESDPHELTNIIATPEHAQVRAELRQRLIAKIVAAGEDPPEIITYEDLGTDSDHPSRQRA